VEDDTKFVPVTVSEKPTSPAKAELRSSATTVGVGLSTANFDALDVPPPGAGLETVTVAAPAAAISAAVIAAVSWVELT
jgi:hypothetical protein